MSPYIEEYKLVDYLQPTVIISDIGRFITENRTKVSYKYTLIYFSIANTMSTLFWATFGMGDTKAAHLDDRFLASQDHLVRTHSVHHKLTVPMGYLLFWSYIGSAVVVMLNMLIAMMSNSFQEIYVRFWA